MIKRDVASTLDNVLYVSESGVKVVSASEIEIIDVWAEPLAPFCADYSYRNHRVDERK